MGICGVYAPTGFSSFIPKFQKHTYRFYTPILYPFFAVVKYKILRISNMCSQRFSCIPLCRIGSPELLLTEFPSICGKVSKLLCRAGYPNLHCVGTLLKFML